MTQDILDGWGEICAYLRVADRKTVQRRGYPVQVHCTGRVYAYRSELDEYRQCPQTPANVSKRPRTSV